LLGYEVDAQPQPRKGLRLVTVGGHIADAYGLAAGHYVLVRPDGYIAAIPSADRLNEVLVAALGTATDGSS
jgi:hypothetical protein